MAKPLLLIPRPEEKCKGFCQLCAVHSEIHNPVGPKIIEMSVRSRPVSKSLDLRANPSQPGNEIRRQHKSSNGMHKKVMPCSTGKLRLEVGFA